MPDSGSERAAAPLVTPPARGTRARWLVLLGVAGLYATLVIGSPAGLFWSPDEGGKYLQMRSYTWHDGLGQRLVYGARQLDPGFRYYPRRSPVDDRGPLPGDLYPQARDNRTVTSNWPFLFPLASLLPFTVLGFRGLYLLPAVAGFGCTLLAGRIARRILPAAEIPTLLAVALCSPILFYSVVFWEHTLATCCATASLLVVTDDRPWTRPRLALVVGCLTLAVVLRLEVVIVIAALAVALALTWLDRRLADPEPRARRRPSLRLVASAGGLAVATVGGAWWVARHPALMDGIGVKESWLLRLFFEVLAWRGLWQDLPGRLQHSLIDLPMTTGPVIEPALAWLAMLGVLIAATAPAWRRGAASSWVMAAAAAVVTAVSGWTVLSPDRFRAVHALVLPTPWVVFAVLLLVPGRPVTGRPIRILRLTSALVLAVTVVLSLTRLIGGLEWGARYYLTGYVLAAICAVTGVGLRLRSEQSRWARAALGASAVAAFAVGALFQLRGLDELSLTRQDLAAYRREIDAAATPVVTDLYWLPAALPETFRLRPVCLVAGPSQLAAWIAQVGARADRFLVVTDGETQDAAQLWQDGARPQDASVTLDQTVAGLRFLVLQVDGEPLPVAPR